MEAGTSYNDEQAVSVGEISTGLSMGGIRTLYAQWEYIPVIGITVTPAEVTLEVGETKQLIATINPSDATNTDVTWSSSDTNIATVDNNGTITGVKKGTATITATTVDGRKTATCTLEVMEPISLPDPDLPLEPPRIKYTVEFNSNGGTGTMEDQEFITEVAQNLSLNKFEKEGHKFIGWNTKANGEGESYADGSSVTNLITFSGSITLYAQWVEEETIIKQSIIKHETNGGNTLSDKTINIETDVDTWGNIPNPKKAGYEFKGWYIEKDFKTEIKKYSDLELEEGKTYTIYAKWEKQSSGDSKPGEQEPGNPKPEQGGQTNQKDDTIQGDKNVISGDKTITNLKMPKAGTNIMLPIIIIGVIIMVIGLYFKLKGLRDVK